MTVISTSNKTYSDDQIADFFDDEISISDLKPLFLEEPITNTSQLLKSIKQLNPIIVYDRKTNRSYLVFN